MSVVLYAQFQGIWCETINLSLETAEDADSTLLRNRNGEVNRYNGRGQKVPSALLI